MFKTPAMISRRRAIAALFKSRQNTSAAALFAAEPRLAALRDTHAELESARQVGKGQLDATSLDTELRLCGAALQSHLIYREQLATRAESLEKELEDVSEAILKMDSEARIHYRTLESATRMLKKLKDD